MSIALLLITDGRGYLEGALRQEVELLPDFDQRVIVDDSDHELGFAGAIKKGWERIAADWVFHFEDDFVFVEPPPVQEMVALLERNPQLVQVALKRQPVNQEEIAAGGIIEQQPHLYTECSDDEATWTEHGVNFTTNPSVYSSRLCRMSWPQEPRSEEVFSQTLLRDPLARFAFWGGKFDPPLVTHVGERAGVGY